MCIAEISLFLTGPAGLTSRVTDAANSCLAGCAPGVWTGCIAAVAGVIWLGWYRKRTADEITSIAGLLKGKIADCRLSNVDCKSKIETGKDLGKLIDGCFSSCRGYVNELEKQVKDLQIQVQLSKRQRANTEAIIYGIRDAVLVIDESDRLLMANESAGRLFGFDFNNSQYKPVDELAGADKSEFVDFLRQARKNRVKATKREIKFSEHNRMKIFDCIVSCVCDENKQVCGAVAVLHDITREKEISQMKDDFVSYVSHELRTPLASIMAYSEMLLDDEADDEQKKKEFYSVIQGQANRLNRLIEDILNTARIESGLIKVDKKPVSLTVLIEEQLPMLRGFAEEKSISLSWGSGGQKPIVFDQVYADKDMISQVIVNLLSNAVKYTPSGGSVRIETGVDEIKGTAAVSITDTGVGIPEDQLEWIFDKFHRVEATKNQAKGTGLGLNLVKQVIEKIHNGRVFVKSKVGAGSTFGFELPLSRRMQLAER
jgi:two-component system phosphate regulon sensor histidine kinase PhoR